MYQNGGKWNENKYVTCADVSWDSHTGEINYQHFLSGVQNKKIL